MYTGRYKYQPKSPPTRLCVLVHDRDKAGEARQAEQGHLRTMYASTRFTPSSVGRSGNVEIMSPNSFKRISYDVFVPFRWYRPPPLGILPRRVAAKRGGNRGLEGSRQTQTPTPNVSRPTQYPQLGQESVLLPGNVQKVSSVLSVLPASFTILLSVGKE